MAFCANCGKDIESGDKFCRECGYPVKSDDQKTTYQYQYQYQSEDRSFYDEIEPEVLNDSFVPDPEWPVKSRIVAGILGILLGGLGVHMFYLGKIWQGILMLLFIWTGIPELIGLIQGIIYLTQSDEEFMKKNQVITDDYR